MRTFSRQAEKSASVPTVHLTKNKSRIKRYNSNTSKPIYYLQDGEEFQLEIFNPTSDVIKAVIFMNGKVSSLSGLVVQPGERVFLDRYLDSTDKYRFGTYEVGKGKEVEKAIQDNGEIEVRFFRDANLIYNNPTTTITTTWPDNDYIWGSPTITNTGGNFYTPTTTSASGVFYSSANTSQTVGTQLLCDTVTSGFNSLNSPKKQETGRVEKGSKSNQELSYSYHTFQTVHFYSVSYKLLPLSQKNVSSSDLKVARYCTNCGAKLKPTHKFCPHCGTKR